MDSLRWANGRLTKYTSRITEGIGRDSVGSPYLASTILQQLCLTLAQKHKRPPKVADVDRLVVQVEHQYRRAYHGYNYNTGAADFARLIEK